MGKKKSDSPNENTKDNSNDKVIEELKKKISNLQSEKELLEKHFNDPEDIKIKIKNLFEKEKQIEAQSKQLEVKEKLLSKEFDELNACYESLKTKEEKTRIEGDKLKVRETGLDKKEKFLEALQSEVQSNKMMLETQISVFKEEKNQLVAYTNYFKEQTNQLECLKPEIDAIYAENRKKNEQIRELRQIISSMQNQIKENSVNKINLNEALKKKFKEHENQIEHVANRLFESNGWIKDQLKHKEKQIAEMYSCLTHSIMQHEKVLETFKPYIFASNKSLHLFNKQINLMKFDIKNINNWIKNKDNQAVSVTQVEKNSADTNRQICVNEFSDTTQTDQYFLQENQFTSELDEAIEGIDEKLKHIDERIENAVLRSQKM